MKKIALTLGLLGLSALANAADPLNGTVWKTIDDKTKQPKAMVKFTEQKNGTLSASIQSVLTPGEENACKKCEGPYHNKSLKGLTIVKGLKNAGGTRTRLPSRSIKMVLYQSKTMAVGCRWIFTLNTARAVLKLS